VHTHQHTVTPLLHSSLALGNEYLTSIALLGILARQINARIEMEPLSSVLQVCISS